jgi:hypothetical protein
MYFLTPTNKNKKNPFENYLRYSFSPQIKKEQTEEDFF